MTSIEIKKDICLAMSLDYRDIKVHRDRSGWLKIKIANHIYNMQMNQTARDWVCLHSHGYDVEWSTDENDTGRYHLSVANYDGLTYVRRPPEKVTPVALINWQNEGF
jgi:hypothetical protein